MVPPHKVLSVEDGKIPNNRLMSRLKTLHTLYLHLEFGEARLHFLVGILPSKNARPTKKIHADQYEFLKGFEARKYISQRRHGGQDWRSRACNPGFHFCI